MYPQKPTFGPLVDPVAKQKAFGPLLYKEDPLPSNKENIVITNGFVKANIVSVAIPQLAFLHVKTVQFHHKAAEALKAFFDELETTGAIKDIVSYDGTFCPRLIRGGHTLSNHSFGTAIDLNVAWNPLGAEGAKEGEKGCMWRVAEIGAKHGFFWGGWYIHRKDSMHLEYSIT